MGLNWEPSGHPTEGVYTIPHFDFHFYMISEEEVMNITGAPRRRLSGSMRLLPHASTEGQVGTAVYLGLEDTFPRWPTLHGSACYRSRATELVAQQQWLLPDQATWKMRATRLRS